MENAWGLHWQELHRRVVSGESLNAVEQETYDAGCEAQDTAESLDGDLSRLRDLRAQIAQAEAEQQRLRRQEQTLDARIADLEAHLDERTRRLLGIGV